MPGVRLIIMCHKMVSFLSTYRLLSRLVFNPDLFFLWKTNFKSRPDALSEGWNIKHFLLWCRLAKLTELSSFASFFQSKLNRRKQSSHFLFNFVDVTGYQPYHMFQNLSSQRLKSPVAIDFMLLTS